MLFVTLQFFNLALTDTQSMQSQRCVAWMTERNNMLSRERVIKDACKNIFWLKKAQQRNTTLGSNLRSLLDYTSCLKIAVCFNDDPELLWCYKFLCILAYTTLSRACVDSCNSNSLPPLHTLYYIDTTYLERGAFTVKTVPKSECRGSNLLWIDQSTSR